MQPQKVARGLKFWFLDRLLHLGSLSALSFWGFANELRREKTSFCICENKDADQLHGNREADQRLCFRYMDNTIPILPSSEILSL